MPPGSAKSTYTSDLFPAWFLAQGRDRRVIATSNTADLAGTFSKVRVGDLIVTAGTTEARLQSPFPPAIPIGTVRKIDTGEGELDRRIHITPAADVRKLDIVQVLTKPHANLQAAVP